MALQLKSVDLKKEKIDYLVVPVCEKLKMETLGAPLKPLVEKAKAIKEFSGKKGESITFYEPASISASRVEFKGLGETGKLDRESLRSMAGTAVKSAIGKKLSHLHIAIPRIKKTSLTPSDIIEAIAEGACLANHVFDRYKKEKEQKPLEKIFLVVTAAEAKKYQKPMDRIETICAGTLLTRDWVSTPSNDKGPEVLAQDFASRAEKEGLTVEILDEQELKRLKFGALLAVSLGSEQNPVVILMRHFVPNAQKTVLLVGKGITFDSGGINIKHGPAMETMKIDMAGAAAVAATLITAARLKLKVNLIGIMPLVENMPSGKATRPGDIITSFQGKTIEIGNTDAEGRLILADAMAYGIDRFKPDITVDLATLTGACMAALGEKIAGVFTMDDELAERLTGAGVKTHERCWRLPLPEDYKDLIKSDLADIKNMSSSSYGGAITAALFLSEFAGNTRWAHLDIAGTAFLKNATDYTPAGGSGYGVRLLMELLETL
ncbi:MAG: leucyl aminopeptidase [Pseudomonadota bacterium]